MPRNVATWISVLSDVMSKPLSPHPSRGPWRARSNRRRNPGTHQSAAGTARLAQRQSGRCPAARCIPRRGAGAPPVVIWFGVTGERQQGLAQRTRQVPVQHAVGSSRRADSRASRAARARRGVEPTRRRARPRTRAPARDAPTRRPSGRPTTGNPADADSRSGGMRPSSAAAVVRTSAIRPVSSPAEPRSARRAGRAGHPIRSRRRNAKRTTTPSADGRAAPTAAPGTPGDASVTPGVDDHRLEARCPGERPAALEQRSSGEDRRRIGSRWDVDPGRSRQAPASAAVLSDAAGPSQDSRRPGPPGSGLALTDRSGPRICKSSAKSTTNQACRQLPSPDRSL